MQPRRRKQSMVILGVAAWLAVGVMGAAAAWLVASEPASEPALDARGCAVGQAPSHHLQILVDGTDPLTADQIGFARAALRERIAAMPAGALVETYQLLGGGDPRLWAPVAARCLPRQGGVSANPLIENPRLLQKRFEEALDEVLRYTINEPLAQGMANESPLLRALHELGTRFKREATIKQLVIVSDLLEISRSTIDQYHQDASRPFSAIRGRLDRELLTPALAGVDASVLYLYRMTRRGEAIQPPAHRGFWTDALTAMGATVAWTDEVEYSRQHPVAGQKPLL